MLNGKKHAIGENLLYLLVWTAIILVPVLNSQMLAEMHVNFEIRALLNANSFRLVLKLPLKYRFLTLTEANNVSGELRNKMRPLSLMLKLFIIMLIGGLLCCTVSSVVALSPFKMSKLALPSGAIYA